MTKHLRLIMLSLLAMICLGGYSQSETDFTTVSWKSPYTFGKYTMTAVRGSGQTNPIQSKKDKDIRCYAKNKLTVSAKDGKMVKIVFVLSEQGKKQCSQPTVDNGTVKRNPADETQGVSEVIWENSNGSTSVTFTIGSKADWGTEKSKAGQLCFDKIVITDASSKTPTTVTFKGLTGTGVNLINGKLDGIDFTGYTAVVADKVAGKIAYTAAGDGVATVDEKTGAVTVYPNVFGTTTITATFTPTDTEKYAESTASYTVINERTPTTITFGSGVDNNTFEVKDGDTFEARVAKCTTKGATGSIEYKSSDEAIAKVDATTGVITLGAKYGTAVITATFVATGSFANSEASYSIKHVGDFVFYESFDKCDGYGGNDNKWSGNLLGEELKPERADNPGWTFVNGRERNQCASFGATDNGGSATSPNIQIDQKAQLKFKASRWSTDREKSQIKISVSHGTLTYNGKNSQSVTIDVVRDTWTDYSMIVSGTNSFTVKFAGFGKYNRFFLDEVMVTKVAPQEITLEENSDNIVEAAENVNVTLKRTFYKDGEWNTLCLPFAVANAKTAFDGAELREVDTQNSHGNTIVFKEATAIEAGKPYLIKWANSSSDAVNVEKKFEGVTLVAAATPVVVKEGGISFNGFYKMTAASELGGASVAAIGAGNKLFKVTEGKMKGFRAAFVLPSGAEATKYKVVIDGTATGIEDLVIDGVKANGRVYNLNGQYVGNSLNGLQPGLYIQNGKKIVVK